MAVAVNAPEPDECGTGEAIADDARSELDAESKTVMRVRLAASTIMGATRTGLLNFIVRATRPIDRSMRANLS
jgi:hypothetical protein